MTKRWTRVVERLGRAVGYKTKTDRAERLEAAEEQARGRQSHVDEENERAGRRYLRP